jgi:guanine nucleotide-binding protein subunit alpha
LNPDPRNRRNIRYFRERDYSNVDMMDQDVINKIIDLWKDEAIQIACERCKNYQIQVSQLPYLMSEENFFRILNTEFVPSNEDILRGRMRTTGSNTTRFLHMNYIWEIVDIGGQAPERVKWFNVLKAPVNAVIYFAGLDEYNMNSSEEEGKTKMEISMECFKSVMQDSQKFKCARILFLNKMDLFKEKIKTKRGYNEFVKTFPDYNDFMKGGDKQSQVFHFMEDEEESRSLSCIKFLEKKFKSLLSDDPEIEDIIIKSTTAVDTQQMGTIFDGIKTSIFQARMDDSVFGN